MNFRNATLAQLHLINSEFENCPGWLKQLAKDEIDRRRKKIHTKIQQKERRKVT